MSQNKNLLKLFTLSLFIAFSLFCYCYINFLTPHQNTHSEIKIEEKITELDSEDQEIFFPDVQLFSKAIKGIEGILRVL